MRASQKRNSIRFGRQRQSICHHFLKVSTVRCGETKMQRDEGIPGYLHCLLLWEQLFFPPAGSADPSQPRLTWRQQLPIVITSFPSVSLGRLPIFSFNLPTCFRASGDSLGACLWSFSFPIFHNCPAYSYNQSLIP